jgi:hypothetical protein
MPSTSTIRRILHRHGLITPQPRKRPKAPIGVSPPTNAGECWQSDFTCIPQAHRR